MKNLVKLCRKKLHFYSITLSQCPACYVVCKRNWQLNNKNKACIASKKWYINNPETRKNKTKVSVNNATYRKNHKDKIYSINSKRRATKISASPKWLNKTHLKEIENLYLLVKDLQRFCDEKLQIDHIIPLVNKNVCGLHVPWNLQIITAKENMTKRNYFDGTYDNKQWKLRK